MGVKGLTKKLWDKKEPSGFFNWRKKNASRDQNCKKKNNYEQVSIMK